MKEDLNREQLWFIDESGCNIAMTRDYGRAPDGERVSGRRPFNRGENVTMIGAVGLGGIGPMMTINGGTSGPVFLSYVEHVLAPILRPGDVVLMDNLSAHKVANVESLIKARGAQLMYLPPYSPDLNPIEPMWSKLKSILKTIGARTRRKLDNAIGSAIQQISPADCLGWFAHCGYGA